jgi:hypothetical protein
MSKFRVLVEVEDDFYTGLAGTAQYVRESVQSLLTDPDSIDKHFDSVVVLNVEVVEDE